MEDSDILEELLSVEVEIQDVQGAFFFFPLISDQICAAFANVNKYCYFLCVDQIRALIERQEKLYERKSELQAILEACKESEKLVNISNGASSSNNVESWSGSFEWDSEADDIRLNIFGISSYRANQREVNAKKGITIKMFFYL